VLCLLSFVKETGKDYKFVFWFWMEYLVLKQDLGNEISATPLESKLSKVLSQFAKQNIFFVRIKF